MASIRPKSLTTHGKGRFVSCPTRPRKYGVADRSTQKLMPRSLWMRSRPSIQTVASLKKSSRFFLFAENSASLVVRLLAADAVGVVGLVVHHQDVLLAAHLAAEDAVDQRRIALDVADRFDADLLEIPALSRSSSSTVSSPAATCRSKSSRVR